MTSIEGGLSIFSDINHDVPMIVYLLAELREFCCIGIGSDRFVRSFDRTTAVRISRKPFVYSHTGYESLSTSGRKL